MRRHQGSRVAIAAVAVLGVGAVAVASSSPFQDSDTTPPPQQVENTPYRAFSADSWFNTPLPDGAPLNPGGEAILGYLNTGPESGDGCVRLAGAGDSPWGHPIYWSGDGDPVYDLEGVEENRPPEVDRLRIPRSAEPASNSDGHMSIFDMDKGYVVALTDAEFDDERDEWSAAGATVTYLESNGLFAETGQSDDPRNIGTHRGNNGAVMAVRLDMVEAGAINHVLKIAAGPEVSERFIFPMVGSDGDVTSGDPAVPPQGLRLRLKPSLDLESVEMSEQALVIARALQRYGAYIGDSGGVTALKLENTIAEGRGQLWQVSATDLCGLPLTPEYWDVIAEDYDPREGT
jgi:hypothetical protein